METRERRYLQVKELRVQRDADKPKIVGYAAVFNRLSENLGGFREKIKPGAFKNALKKSDARALFNHDSNYVLGRQGAGTLTLKEDDKGLWMEIDPPDTQFARDLMVSIERGDINQQSFGFTVASDSWEDLNKQESLRTLNEIDELFDVSPVTFPAYPDTSVALRSMEAAKATGAPLETSETPDTETTTETREDHIASLLREIISLLKPEERTAPAATSEEEPPENPGETATDEPGDDLDPETRDLIERAQKLSTKTEGETK